MGRIISNEEVESLKEAFGQKLPQKLLELLRTKEVIGEKFKLSEEEDKSGLGVAMQWFTPQEQIEESFEFYPGIVAINEDYIPVGKCLEGSGDPYFVKQEDMILKLYRIPHDCVRNNAIDEAQVEYVCQIDGFLASI